MAEETRHREESKLICGLARGLSHVRAAQEAGVSIRNSIRTVQRRAASHGSENSTMLLVATVRANQMR